MKSTITFLKKSFGFENRFLSLKLISHFLVKCAKANSYVETLGKHADSLHLWIKSSYEENFRKAFEIQVRQIIKRLNVRHAQIAFDITHEPFYGKTRNLHIFNTPKNKKYHGEFQFITCCLINKGKAIPLMALPVRLSEQSKLIIDLLKYCMNLFPHIKIALFDRGFYITELIDFLEANHVNYLMLVPEKKGVIKSYVESTQDLGKFEHHMRYSKEKSIWKPKTQITVCKNIFDFDWIFATNIQFNRAIDYVLLYKRRWQIETNYRVEDEAKIKSKSSNYLVRYFYFLLSQLLHLFWIIHKKECFYVQFKKYLDIIEHKMFFDYLRIGEI